MQFVIDNDWQVESMRVHADSALQFPDSGKVYIMSFENKTIDLSREFSLKIDFNTCWGKVNFKVSNKVKFNTGACTEVCCFSEFAENLISLVLDNLSNYERRDTKLTFTGKGGEVLNLTKK